MSRGSLALAPPTYGGPADRWTAGATVALLGVGTLVALVGAVTSNVTLAIVGGGVVVAALFTLFLGDWLDGLALLALSLPLPALAGSEEARMAPAAILTGLVVGALAIRIAVRREPLQLGALPVRGVALFGTALVVSAMFAANKPVALRELVNLGSMLGLLVVTTHEIQCGRLNRGRLVSLLAAAAGIAGVVAVVQSLGIWPTRFPMYLTRFYRATIGFGWPNESGLFFAVSFPVCVLAYRLAPTRFARATFVVATVACGVGLLCTFSRGSWLAAFLAPVALLMAGAGRGAIRGWLACALVVVLVDVVTGGALSGRFTNSIGENAVLQRADLMYLGVLMFLDHPWVGVGPGGFGDSLEVYGPQLFSLTDYIGSAHNGYIEIAAETGVFGLTGFLILLAGAFLGTVRWARGGQRDPLCSAEEKRTRLAVLWMLTVVPLNAMTIWPFAHGTGQLIVFVVAMAVARPRVLTANPATGALPRNEELPSVGAHP